MRLYLTHKSGVEQHTCTQAYMMPFYFDSTGRYTPALRDGNSANAEEVFASLISELMQ
jgi:hypothetical protein